MARFTIVGNYLYTVDKTDLKVFDIANPAAPVFRQTVPVGFEIETIFPFKDKLFIGSTSVVHIFSIADPAPLRREARVRAMARGEAEATEYARNNGYSRVRLLSVEEGVSYRGTDIVVTGSRIMNAGAPPPPRRGPAC